MQGDECGCESCQLTVLAWLGQTETDREEEAALQRYLQTTSGASPEGETPTSTTEEATR